MDAVDARLSAKMQDMQAQMHDMQGQTARSAIASPVIFVVFSRLSSPPFGRVFVVEVGGFFALNPL